MKLIDHVDKMDEYTSPRKVRELTVISLVLTQTELENISSLRVGYALARDRLIEDFIQFDDPWLYERIKKARSKIPIFNIEEIAKEFNGVVNSSSI